jgi:tRNA nucleotidyltransferase (CCA-adding enzyme)
MVRGEDESKGAAGWAEPRESKALDRILADALPGGSLFAVGGRVRDELRSQLDGLPRPAKDLDYVAVGVTLDDLVERLRTVGRAELVGASFAVVKATIGATTVDVALPRREFSTGAGHREFTVEAGPAVSLQDDLARRDFRMNMLARAIPSGEIVDPYGGREDIEAGRIELLRPEAFLEDPLRMLRAAQFAARFEFVVGDATLEAMRAAAHLVGTVSPERTRDELMKMLTLAARPSLGVEVMRAGGLLPYVLPELAEGIGIEQNEYHAFDVYRHGLATLDATPPGELLLRVSALLHDVGKPRTKDGPHFYRHEIVGEGLAHGLLERLRFPNEIVERAARLVRQHMYQADPELSPATLRRFIRRVGVDNLELQFALRDADVIGSGLPKRGDNNERFAERVRAILAEKPPLAVTDLAVTGSDAIAALTAAGKLPPGSRGGPAVGVVLRAVLERLLDDPHLGRDEQLVLIREASAASEEHEIDPERNRTPRA